MTDGNALLTSLAFDYPIYGTQWHPEKNAFEWRRPFVAHTPSGVRVTFFMAEFFVSEGMEAALAIASLLWYQWSRWCRVLLFSVMSQPGRTSTDLPQRTRRTERSFTTSVLWKVAQRASLSKSIISDTFAQLPPSRRNVYDTSCNAQIVDKSDTLFFPWRKIESRK